MLKTITHAKQEYTVPKAPFIGLGAEKLYRLESTRNEAFKAAAAELGKLLDHDASEYWTRTMPEALHAILDAFDHGAGIAAAVAILQKRGYTITPPSQEGG